MRGALIVRLLIAVFATMPACALEHPRTPADARADRPRDADAGFISPDALDATDVPLPTCDAGSRCTPANPCRIGVTACAGRIATCTETVSELDGTNCGDDRVCHAGVCTACVAGTGCALSNPCRLGINECTTGVLVCSDSGMSAADGTPCGAGMVCRASACVACATGPCPPTNPCHLGMLVCGTGTAVCADTMMPAAPGTPCGLNRVCSAGTCVPCVSGAGCLAPNPCRVATIRCTTGSAVCTETGANVPNGLGCGTNMVCNGGACVACVTGVGCALSNPCRVGTTACTTGSPTCVDRGPVANGTACGASQVCLAGVCRACTEGATCVPVNRCRTGAIACSSGVPVCAETGSVADGSVCGSNLVCRGGACVACVSNAPCASPPNPCRVGTTSCASGVSVCTDTVTNVADGSPCGTTGGVCRAGTCVPCVAGLMCTPANNCHVGGTTCGGTGLGCMDTGSPLPTGTACGLNRVCSSGTCVSCTAGVACPLPGNPCRVGRTSCATGASVCVDGGAAPDGTVCSTGVCWAGACLYDSCREIHSIRPGAASGAFMISPGGRMPFQVYCDMNTDGGGWTVVSINGDLSPGASACVHRLRNDAPACGSAPAPNVDWQLDGALQDTIRFTQVALVALTDTGAYFAATRLDAGTTARTIGLGAFAVTPVAVGGTPLTCMAGVFANRRRIAVALSGYTVWGVDNPACSSTSGVAAVLGLNVPTGLTHDFPGWDDENAACGCGNMFSPAELGMRRGYYGLR